MNAKDVLEHVDFADIIRAASGSVLGILALVILVCCVLAVIFFKKASMKIRLCVFAAFFLSTVGLGAVVLTRFTPVHGSAGEKSMSTTNAVTDVEVATAIATPPRIEALPLGETPQKLNVIFKTARKDRAGTDANVSIVLYGTKHVSKKYTFSGRGKPFEQGTTDIFTISAFPPLGEITKCVVSRDNAGDKEEWFLEYVEVVDLETGAKVTFPHNNWVGWVGFPSKSLSATLKPKK